MSSHPTRGAWITDMADRLRGLFDATRYEVPENVRCSCAREGRAKGPGWCTFEGARCGVYVSPDVSDPVNVAEILLHELVHAALGARAGHGRKFQRCAAAVGLVYLSHTRGGTFATAECLKTLRSFVEECGPYPPDARREHRDGRQLSLPGGGE